MITIEKGEKNLNGRTIDPSDGFDITGTTLTLYSFKRYNSSSHNTSASVSIIEQTKTAILIKVESIDWHKKSQYPYKTAGCFIVQLEIGKRGRGQLGVDRVPCSVDSIAEAINFLTPAEVRKAQDAGRKVLRQGDFFFVEKKGANNLNALNWTNHSTAVVKKGLSVRHPEHHVLLLPAGIGWKAVQRKTMNHIKAD